MSEQPFRCGFVAVVGRPNVGKSTLINAIFGRKISIVTHKPQTTRHRILAVESRQDCQIIFVDTPGLHRKAGKAINRMMNRTAASALIDADVVLFMTVANHWTVEDQHDIGIDKRTGCIFIPRGLQTPLEVPSSIFFGWKTESLLSTGAWASRFRKSQFTTTRCSSIPVLEQQPE